VVQLDGHEASSIARLLESIARIWVCAFAPAVIFRFDTFHAQGLPKRRGCQLVVDQGPASLYYEKATIRGVRTWT